MQRTTVDTTAVVADNDIADIYDKITRTCYQFGRRTDLSNFRMAEVHIPGYHTALIRTNLGVSFALLDLE